MAVKDEIHGQIVAGLKDAKFPINTPGAYRHTTGLKLPKATVWSKNKFETRGKI